MAEDCTNLSKLDEYIHSSDVEICTLGMTLISGLHIDVVYAFFEKYAVSNVGFYAGVHERICGGTLKTYVETHFNMIALWFNADKRIDEEFHGDGFYIKYFFVGPVNTQVLLTSAPVPLNVGIPALYTPSFSPRALFKLFIEEKFLPRYKLEVYEERLHGPKQAL